MRTKLFDARWFQSGEQKLTETQARIPGALVAAWLKTHRWLLVRFDGATPTEAFSNSLADAILREQVDDGAWKYVERVADAQPYYDLLEELGPDLDTEKLDTWDAADRVAKWLDSFAGVSARAQPSKLVARVRRLAKNGTLLPENIEVLLGQISADDAAALAALLETPADSPLPVRYLHASAKALFEHARGGVSALQKICLDRAAGDLLRRAAVDHLQTLAETDVLVHIALAVQEEKEDPAPSGLLWKVMNSLQQASLKKPPATSEETERVRRLSESLVRTRDEPAWAIVIPLLGLIGDVGSMELIQTDHRFDLDYQKALKRKAVSSIRRRL